MKKCSTSIFEKRFLNIGISTRKMQKCQAIGNIMKSERIAGLQKMEILTRDINTRGGRPKSFSEG